MSIVPQQSKPCPFPFNISVNGLGEEADCILSKFANNTKVGCGADSPEGRAALQRDLDRLEKQADRNPLKFSKERCRVLLMGRNNPRTCWGLPSWGAALKKRTWGYRWTPA